MNTVCLVMFLGLARFKGDSMFLVEGALTLAHNLSATLDGTNGVSITGTSPQVEDVGDPGDEEVSCRAGFDQKVASS